MELLTWTNALALLAFVALFLDFSNKKRAGSILLGVLVLVITIVKGCQDGRESKLMGSKTDSVRWLLDTLSARSAKIDTLVAKIDTFDVFLHRLSSMGVKDVNNFPIFIKGNGNTSVQSYGQKGGQTGRDIYNNPPPHK